MYICIYIYIYISYMYHIYIYIYIYIWCAGSFLLRQLHFEILLESLGCCSRPNLYCID